MAALVFRVFLKCGWRFCLVFAYLKLAIFTGAGTEALSNTQLESCQETVLA
jgi:hypothetical protein